ncbi:endonuclease/exonuclease/phosphatase family protein, partial [Candidatus Sumerlaeota bacterium]|nr:endonuclease/exonuclease/phosphatase family protein [Candidatus Sumerlaeota bacterium]
MISSRVGAESHAIFMDGHFDDWIGLTPIYSDASGDQGAGNIDFGRIWATNDSERFYLRFEVGTEINLQSNNSIYLYLDSDNNASTGLAINNIGADFSIAFGERTGRYYGVSEETFNLNTIGYFQLPTVTSQEFEITIPRNAVYDGTAVFQATTVSLLLVNNIPGSYDQAPEVGETLSYTFDETPTPPYTHIPLARESAFDIRILTYNVLRDGLFTRTTYFERILRALKPDVLNFQELYSYSAGQTKDLISQILPLGDGEEWYAAKVSPDCITVSEYPILQSWQIDGNMAVLLNIPGTSLIKDLLIINAHLPCCSDDEGRQRECDHIIAFLHDAKTNGTLPHNTPFIILGDLNLVGYAQQLDTLLSGDIVNESIYGSDHIPDWDGTPLTDVVAYHTAKPDAFTWYNESSTFCPGRLDYIIYSDSVLEVGRHFVLRTEEMSAGELTQYGL